MLKYKTINEIKEDIPHKGATYIPAYYYYLKQFNSFMEDNEYIGYTEEEKQKAIILKNKLRINHYDYDDDIIDELGDKIPLFLLTDEQAKKIGYDYIKYSIDIIKNRLLAFKFPELEKSYFGKVHNYYIEYYQSKNLEEEDVDRLLIDALLIDEIEKYKNNPEEFFDKLGIKKKKHK